MKNKYIFTLVFALIAFSIWAQPTLPGTGSGGGNVEDNPIHFLIPIALAIGAFLGFRKHKNDQNFKINN